MKSDDIYKGDAHTVPPDLPPVRRESPETRSTGSGASARQAKRSHDRRSTDLIAINITNEAYEVIRGWINIGDKTISEAIIAADSVGKTIHQQWLAAHTKSTRQSLVAEIREKMPEKIPPEAPSLGYAGDTAGREQLIVWRKGHNAALNQVNLILTEIEGGE